MRQRLHRVDNEPVLVPQLKVKPTSLDRRPSRLAEAVPGGIVALHVTTMRRSVRADDEPQWSGVLVSQVYPLLTRLLGIVDSVDDHILTQPKQL
jgi:hypothetical protein